MRINIISKTYVRISYTSVVAF